MAAGEVTWPFDRTVKEHVAAGLEVGGYPVMTLETGVEGHTSHVGLGYEAITVDPNRYPLTYRMFTEDGGYSTADAASAETPRQHFAGGILQTAREALTHPGQREYEAFIDGAAPEGVVDLGLLLRAGLGDARAQAVGAAFLIERLAPGLEPHVDQNMVEGADGVAVPQSWARYIDLELDPKGIFGPLATVIIDPANNVAQTLWGTRDETGRSPYARPSDEALMEDLAAKAEHFPIVGGMVRELGDLAYRGSHRASALFVRATGLERGR